MKSSRRIPVGITALMAAALACNISVNAPVEQPNPAFTAAAQTVAAELTALGSLPSPTGGVASPIPGSTLPAATLQPLPTSTSFPTSTFVPTATQLCDKAAFVQDLTIPDGSILAQAQVFTKTWRLKNIGTCSWTPSYPVVFFSGEAMSGPAVQALAGNVDPGQTVDISVNLKAPPSNGNYTGYWKLRNASGVTFSQFYVQVSVQGGGASTTVTLSKISAESGQVRTDGTVLLPTNTGDTTANDSVEAFFSFDISGIPTLATITEVLVDFSSFDMLGNPFDLGDNCVRAYVHDYGALTFADYFFGDPVGAVARWCSTAELFTVSANEYVATALQARVSGGASRFHLRVQFRTPTTNSDGVADMIRFGSVALTITYQP